MKSLIAGLTLLVVALGAYIGGLKDQATPVFGGVPIGSESFATSTKTFVGGNNLSNFVVLSNYNGCATVCPGTVTTIDIAGANTGIIRLWDATTTNVNLRAPGAATTTLTYIEIPASHVAMNKSYDVNFNNGILYELVSGTAPTSTIAWRNR